MKAPVTKAKAPVTKAKAPVTKAKAPVTNPKAVTIVAPVAPVTLVPLPEPAKATVKTMQQGKVSAALKKAFADENNAMAAYKMLGARFDWSVKPVIEALQAEGKWPLTAKGRPQGYKSAYKMERDLGVTSFGHFVNRCSERFTMLNPENINKKEQARKDKEEQDKKEALKKKSGSAG